MSFIQVYLLFSCMFWNKVAIDCLVSVKNVYIESDAITVLLY